MTEKMFKAYEAATRIVDEETSEEESCLLGGVKESDVVVVSGRYDRVENVLSLVDIRHHVINPGAVGCTRLTPEQLLVINCPGAIDRCSVTAVRKFVEKGGSLFTTDWSLKNVLEPAFPGIVEFNEDPTADAVVRIEVKDRDNPFLDDVFHEGSDPLWWLEGSSYPIRVLEPEKVQVLITSNELKAKWGEAPVAITFPFGDGEVFHMISHYYLQRAETRTKRHETSWTEYAAEAGAPSAAKYAPEYMADLNTGEVEAARTSVKMLRRMITRKQRINKERGA